MKIRSSGSRGRLAAWVVGLLCLAYSSSAVALYIIPVGGPVVYWMSVCNDGAMFGPWPDPGSAMHVGGILCDSHGGLAEVTDNGVQGALATIQTCADPSNVTVGRDVGGGIVQALTQAELVSILEQAGGEARELVGLEVLSVVVRGLELHPNPPQSRVPIPIAEIHSDEDGDGSFVGGATGCPAVPMTGMASRFIALGLMTTGWLLTRRRSLEVCVTKCAPNS